MFKWKTLKNLKKCICILENSLFIYFLFYELKFICCCLIRLGTNAHIITKNMFDDMKGEFTWMINLKFIRLEKKTLFVLIITFYFPSY